jgi:alkanesulfonate monooxygenase SsuD/methylene tetrahydromethanopterin reductase-like flavin-dependent oxidoreductase (luciferase family)
VKFGLLSDFRNPDMENGYALWSRVAGDLPTDRTLRTDRDLSDMRQEDYCIGDPEYAATRIRRLSAEIPVHTLVMRMQFPGLDPVRSSRSMELFARHVAPRLRVPTGG